MYRLTKTGIPFTTELLQIPQISLYVFLDSSGIAVFAYGRQALLSMRSFAMVFRINGLWKMVTFSILTYPFTMEVTMVT